MEISEREKPILSLKSTPRTRWPVIGVRFQDIRISAVIITRLMSQSGVTLSNIYNYFRDKDEIFRAVLTPLLNAFEQLFAEHNSDDYMSKEFFSMDSHQKKLIDDFMVIPTNYRTELKILLFNSATACSGEKISVAFTAIPRDRRAHV